jgi:hypothetical protein
MGKRQSSRIVEAANRTEKKSSAKTDKNPSDNEKSKSAARYWATIGTAFVTAIAVALGTSYGSKLGSLFPHSTKPAVSVNTEPDATLLSNQGWLLPSGFPPSRLKPDYEDVSSWAPSLGARPAGSMALKVSVTAQVSGGVTITGIEANVTKRATLTPHMLADNPGQGGGITRNTTVGLNLDETDPSALSFEDGMIGPTTQSLAKAYFSEYSVDLPKGATHVFELVAYAQKADDQFSLRIDYISNGKNGHIDVMNSGKPFGLAGYSGNTRFTAIYFPGYIADPPKPNKPWTDIGTQLCPIYYRPC